MDSSKASRVHSGGQLRRLILSTKSNLMGAASAVMLFGVCDPAMASVMDFNNLPTETFGIVDAGATITQNGYTIHDTTAGSIPFNTQVQGAASGWQNGRGTDNGTTTVGMESVDSNSPISFTLTSQASTPFNLLSIDIGSLDANDPQFHNTISTVWTFLGNLSGGGTVSETIDTNPDQILTYALSSAFQGLTSVDITAKLPVMGIATSNDTGLTADFDNIVATQSDVRGAVPEPSTWALMIGGFGLAGAVLRRRRALVAA
jgi:hypothetical protein